jgi:hypothetical protein
MDSGPRGRGRDGRSAFEPGERNRRRGRPLRLPSDLYPVHRFHAQKAVPLGGPDQPREAGEPGARGSFVLQRQEKEATYSRDPDLMARFRLRR